MLAVSRTRRHRKAGGEDKERRRRQRLKVAVVLREASGEGEVRMGRLVLLRCRRRG